MAPSGQIPLPAQISRNPCRVTLDYEGPPEEAPQEAWIADANTARVCSIMQRSFDLLLENTAKIRAMTETDLDPNTIEKVSRTVVAQSSLRKDKLSELDSTELYFRSYLNEKGFISDDPKNMKVDLEGLPYITPDESEIADSEKSPNSNSKWEIIVSRDKVVIYKGVVRRDKYVSLSSKFPMTVNKFYHEYRDTLPGNGTKKASLDVTEAINKIEGDPRIVFSFFCINAKKITYFSTSPIPTRSLSSKTTNLRILRTPKGYTLHYQDGRGALIDKPFKVIPTLNRSSYNPKNLPKDTQPYISYRDALEEVVGDLGKQEPSPCRESNFRHSITSRFKGTGSRPVKVSYNVKTKKIDFEAQTSNSSYRIYF